MGQVWNFLKVRKAWWVTPIVLAAALLALLVATSYASSPGPFVYTIF